MSAFHFLDAASVPRPEAAAESRLGFGTLRAFANVMRLARPRLWSDGILLVLLPITVCAYVLSGYQLILAPGTLYAALVAEQWTEFRAALLRYFIIAVGVLAIKVLRSFLQESCALALRTQLAHAIHARYVSECSTDGRGVPPYYALAGGNIVDNPDQRVVGDVRDFSSAVFEIFGGREGSGGVLEAGGSIMWYTLKTADRTGWVGVVAAYGWSITVALITVTVINATAPWVFRQENLEAKLRYGHVALRRRAEEIAFLRGGPAERAVLDRALDAAVANAWVVIQRHIYLNLVQYGFGYFVSLVMYAAIGLSIFSNIMAPSSSSFSSSMTPGDKAKWISQTGGVFIQLLYSFTTIIQLGTATTSFVTNTTRVSQLLDALRVHYDQQGHESGADVVDSEEMSDEKPLVSQEFDSESLPSSSTSHFGEIVVTDLTIDVSESIFIGPVSFSVTAGQWVVMDGPSGVGKTSILRAIRGLWKSSGGNIALPREQVIFAPQRVYLSDSATLRELVLYPYIPVYSSAETEAVVNALRGTGWRKGDFPAVLDRIDQRWAENVSPGEGQMISAARVLAQRPQFVVMDEPTSALDTETEQIVLNSLRDAGIGVLMAGHKDSIRFRHDSTITLATTPLGNDHAVRSSSAHSSSRRVEPS
jgi:ABC-type uncharacterized transport system fused permease/ATPase subunit